MLVPYAVAFFIAMLYGLSAVTEKLVLKVFSAKYLFIASGLLFGTVALIYLCFNYHEFRTNIRNSQLRHHGLLVLSVMAALIVPMYLWFNLLHDNDKVQVWSAITFSAPMFTLLFVYLLMDDDITKWNILGVSFVVVGTLLLAYDR